MEAGCSTLLLLTLATFLHAQTAEELPQVHFIDVGTGDCIWNHTGDDGVDGNGRMEGYNIIIDGGDWGRRLGDSIPLGAGPSRKPALSASVSLQWAMSIAGSTGASRHDLQTRGSTVAKTGRHR